MEIRHGFLDFFKNKERDMKVVDPVKSTKAKQNDKFVLALRLGKLTIFEVSYDVSDQEFRFELLNLAIIHKKAKKTEK